MVLDYAETYPDSVNHYKSSYVVLFMDSDAAYITMLGTRRCYYGHFYMSDFPLPRPLHPTPKINGPIHKECKTIYNVVYSAAEAKTCVTFKNGKRYISM